MFKPYKSRYEMAKDKIMHTGCSLNDLRNELRKEFKSRLLDLRNRQTDAHRRIVGENETSNIMKESFMEIQASLLADKDAVALLDSNTVLEILSQVEKEILEEELERQAETHERNVRLETDAVVESLLNVCSVCEKFVEQSSKNIICRNCAEMIFYSNNV